MSVTAGLSAVSSQVHRQYYFVYDQKNMTEAQKYTDLATIDNMEDVKILNNTVDKSRLVDSEYGQVSSLQSLSFRRHFCLEMW